MCPIASWPSQPAEVLLVEHLRDEAHLAEHGQVAAVRDGDPGRLLAAVLERVQAEVREPGDVAVGRADAEDAAHALAVGLPEIGELHAEHAVAAHLADLA